jgi:hypothetical protein
LGDAEGATALARISGTINGTVPIRNRFRKTQIKMHMERLLSNLKMARSIQGQIMEPILNYDDLFAFELLGRNRPC